jgi:hypothetical protein
MNYVFRSVAHDDKFLRDSLQKTIAVDDFTGRLFQIYDTVTKEGVTQVRQDIFCRGMVMATTKFFTTCTGNDAKLQVKSHLHQGCQIFLGPKYQNGEKYTKVPHNIPNVHKIFPMAVK